jgi:putative hydrolase of the HAD superfamily
MQKPSGKTYQWLFFDLDNTLWDFQQNSETTLNKLIDTFFPQIAHRKDEFNAAYYPINDEFWKQYREGNLTKEILRWKRFSETFKLFGIDDYKKVVEFSEQYVALSPYQTALFPNAVDVLEYLKKKGYKMYLLTNGFKEVQDIKIKTSGLDHYFDKMFTSDEAGYQKPHRKIFEYAVKSANALKRQSLMIGDDLEIDIAGAKQFGIDQVYFNPRQLTHNEKITYEIKTLSELQMFL